MVRQFRLDQGLEALIARTNKADLFRRNAEANPALDNTSLRSNVENFVNDLHGAGLANTDGAMYTEYSPVEFTRATRSIKKQLLERLNTDVDDATYSAAKRHYTAGLDEAVKLELYSEILSDMTLPRAPADSATVKDKEAYKALKLAKRKVDFAKRMEVLAEKGDVSGAQTEAQLYARDTGEQAFDEDDIEAVARANKYASPAALENKKQILRAIGNVCEAEAKALIKEKNLYGAIDSGIAATEYGKAIGLTALYNASKLQENINAQRQAQQSRARN